MSLISTYWLENAMGGQEEMEDEDDGEATEKGDADAILRDFQYQLKCQYMERARNLKVARLWMQLYPYRFIQ